MKLAALAKLALGKVIGPASLEIKRVAPIESAQAGDLVFALEKRFVNAALKSKASALVAPLDTPISGKAAILTPNPRLAMAKILPLFAPKAKPKKGLDKTAVVPRSCRLGKNIYLGPFVILGEKVSVGDGTIIEALTFVGAGTTIGKNCHIHSNVSIYEGVRIGARAILHSGVRVGVDGYGYVQEKGHHLKIPQIGTVVIEDDVEIYANVCISRATLGETAIGTGTKIDSLTHIAHNCKIGQDCAIVSLVGMAGSVTLKDRVYVAGQAGFKGHSTVGENSIVMARAGVTKDIPANSLVSGFPAQDHKKELAYQAALKVLAKKIKPAKI